MIMASPESTRMVLNESAIRIAEPLVSRPQDFDCLRHQVGGAIVIDCGVVAPGTTDAGLLVARAVLAGLGDVTLVPTDSGAEPLADAWPACPWPLVTAASTAPVMACLASQYAGWKVDVDGWFGMCSGPVRAAIGREKLFDSIGGQERPAAALGLLEASTLPTEAVCRRLADDAGVAVERLLLLVARTASQAGTLQIVARSLETALHKLHDLGFDVRRVVSGRGVAPLPPLPPRSGDDLAAIGRTNDAILYGGRVRLEIDATDEELAALGPEVISAASSSHGRSFLELFEAAGRDFYALDPSLFAPACVELVNRSSGRAQQFGRVEPDLVERSFTAAARPGGPA
jgi:methenyltetrahydromethanopterin cyclohydrolase